MKSLFIRKDIEKIQDETRDDPHGLRRVLGPWHLLLLGVGAIIGAGIFVLTGHAAGIAGSAAVLALLVGGLLSYSVALNYCELATTYPVAGGAMFSAPMDLMPSPTLIMTIFFIALIRMVAYYALMMVATISITSTQPDRMAPG